MSSTSTKMHPDEVPTNAALVRRLIRAQFPHWKDLAVEPVQSAGTDNALYRLGEDMVVRMPRIYWAAPQVEKEQRWLPVLAPQLPLSISLPLATGDPGEGYPWHWAVMRWLEGENATADRLRDVRQAAIDLAQFVKALQRIDPTGGPIAGPHNCGRGVPLAERDEAVRKALAELRGMIDTRAATNAWEAALRAPAWTGAPVWLHGDIQSGNLLATDGHLSGVIDWGCMGVGDPACDVMPAWSFLSRETRDAFREAISPDEATWARARGWALSVGLIALPYYRDTNPVLAEISRQTIHEVLADR